MWSDPGGASTGRAGQTMNSEIDSEQFPYSQLESLDMTDIMEYNNRQVYIFVYYRYMSTENDYRDKYYM